MCLAFMAISMGQGTGPKFLEQVLHLSYCPIFNKLAGIMHLDLLIDLKDLDAEFGP